MPESGSQKRRGSWRARVLRAPWKTRSTSPLPSAPPIRAHVLAQRSTGRRSLATAQAGRADEAITVADEALRVTWDYVSIIPERESLHGAAEALAFIGAGEEAARVARRALAAPVQEKDARYPRAARDGGHHEVGRRRGGSGRRYREGARRGRVRPQEKPRTWDEGSRLARCSWLLGLESRKPPTEWPGTHWRSCVPRLGSTQRTPTGPCWWMRLPRQMIFSA